MPKKLTKHGNSLALIIDKPLLELLNISEKTNLELRIENGSLVVKPVKKRAKRSKKELEEIADEILDRYAAAFKKLAE